MERPIDCLIEDRVIMRMIRWFARSITQAIRDRSHEEADVSQELLLNLRQRSRRFDSKKSSFPTFARMVLQHHADSIIKHHAAAKRRALGGMVYLDHAVDTDDDSMSLHELISPGIYHPAWQQPPQRNDHQGLAIDLRRTLRGLPARLREAADALQYMSASEAASRLNIHRSVLYERRAELRRHFERAGLRDYLQM